MPEFWWVSHNQTARQEIDGQYLWSPKTRKDGRRTPFYDNMRRATPGDLVLSFYDRAIRHVGRVAEFAFTSEKPEEFGSIGANWGNQGWLLPVFWTPLEPPVYPKALIATLGPLLPRRYSPIDPVTGSGYQQVYLAEIPEAVFDVVVSGADYDRALLARGGQNSMSFDIIKERLEDAVERRVKEDTNLESTIRQAVILARRGQGKFRENVEAIEQACRLTGITNPSLLIASHIKPWRLCVTAQERLDGNNGLLLTPDADHLFDRGYISFEDDGTVLVSPRVDRHDLRRLGFDQLVEKRFGLAEAPVVWSTDSFRAAQCTYLAFHRDEVYVQ
jgi:hypothetical protein